MLFYLYWVTTERHRCDSFVAATSKELAEQFICKWGKEDVGATAALVAKFPPDWQGPEFAVGSSPTDQDWPAQAGFPCDDGIKACGVRILHDKRPCVYQRKKGTPFLTQGVRWYQERLREEKIDRQGGLV